MPSKPEPEAALTCDQCGYANEPERVYCHNCGAKLDRSLLPRPADKAQEHPDKVRKRLKKMTNPRVGGGKFLREIKALFKVAFFSALLAVVLLVIQKPVDLPEVKKSDSPRLVSSDLMEALGSPRPAAVSFSDNDINQYLLQTLKPKDTIVPGVQVVHAFVVCAPGVLHIYAQHAVWGLPMFSRISYRLEVKDGKFTPTVVGGAFGKLAVDPQLMQYADYYFGALWDALQREHKQMDKMLGVTVQQGRIDLVTKGLGGGR